MKTNAIHKKFSNNLKFLRIRQNKSQQQIAKLLHVPVSTYANWEQGKREPCILQIYNLMLVFNVDANRLFN